MAGVISMPAAAVVKDGTAALAATAPAGKKKSRRRWSLRIGCCSSRTAAENVIEPSRPVPGPEPAPPLPAEKEDAEGSSEEPPAKAQEPLPAPHDVPFDPDTVRSGTKLFGPWDVAPVAIEDLLQIHLESPTAAVASTAPADELPAQQTPPQRVGRLAQSLICFEAAIDGAAPPPAELRREPLVQGFREFAAVLDALGGSMGSYILTNVAKLDRSKADPACAGYLEWLLSELPVHAATGYRSYVDDSAWMANLWICWSLEFFVEFFAQLHSGAETKQAVDVAYKQTLYQHHNMFQRAAFLGAVKSLPDRRKFYEELRGSDAAADDETLQRDLGDFVAAGRIVAKFCAKANDTVSERLQEERAGKSKR